MTNIRSNPMTDLKRIQENLNSCEFTGPTSGEPLRLICIALGIAWLALVSRIAAEWL